MTTRAATTVNPSSLERALADQLHAVLHGADGPATLRVGDREIDLPPELTKALGRIVDIVHAGGQATVAASDALLTTQDAADLAGVSRPTMVRILESGAVPFVRHGTQRRVAMEDLMRYLDEERVRRRAILDRMAEEVPPYTNSGDTFVRTR